MQKLKQKIKIRLRPTNFSFVNYVIDTFDSDKLLMFSNNNWFSFYLLTNLFISFKQ